MLHIAVLGQDTLAAAVETCCRSHFSVTRGVMMDTQLVWFCYDTPIGDNGAPNNSWVIDRLREHINDIPYEVPILMSSQMPVGSIAFLEDRFIQHTFLYSPENIRVARAVADFTDQARIVVGRRTTRFDAMLTELLSPFTKNIILTDPETAEMVKHALNCYLGMNIAFINEIARACVVVGADVDTVSRALLTERRVSPHAPLRAGAPFGEGHLARDIYTLTDLGAITKTPLPIISNILPSNEVHAAVPIAS